MHGGMCIYGAYANWRAFVHIAVVRRGSEVYYMDLGCDRWTQSLGLELLMDWGGKTSVQTVWSVIFCVFLYRIAILSNFLYTSTPPKQKTIEGSLSLSTRTRADSRENQRLCTMERCRMMSWGWAPSHMRWALISPLASYWQSGHLMAKRPWCWERCRMVANRSVCNKQIGESEFWSPWHGAHGSHRMPLRLAGISAKQPCLSAQ